MGWSNAGGWQSGGWGRVATGGGGGAHSTAYTNFIARTVGLDTTHQNAYAALLDGLTTDGIFNSDGTSSYLDALYCFKTADSTTASLNLVSSSFTITTSGSPTFTADAGWATHAATSDYLNSNFNPNTATTPKWSINSAQCGVWGLSGWTAGAYAAGTDQAGFRLFALFPNQSTTSLTGTINVNAIFSGTTAASTPANNSYVAVDRSASNASAVYYEGSSVGIDATLADVMPNGNITFGANPAGSNYYDQTLGAACFGKSLGSGLQSAIRNRIATFISTV